MVSRVVNYRDVGACFGVPGIIFRCGLLRDAQNKSFPPMAEVKKNFGIKTLIDLRSRKERAPKDTSIDGARVIKVTLIGSAVAKKFLKQMTCGDRCGALACLCFSQRKMLSFCSRRLNAPTFGLVGFYKTVLEQSGGIFVEILREIGADQSLPLVFFCSMGKDRTGLLAVLLMSVCGCPREQVIAEYAKSADELAPVWPDILRCFEKVCLDPVIFAPTPAAQALAHNLTSHAAASATSPTPQLTLLACGSPVCENLHTLATYPPMPFVLPFLLLLLCSASGHNIQAQSNEEITRFLGHRFAALKSNAVFRPATVLPSLGEYSDLQSRFGHLLESPLNTILDGTLTVVMTTPSASSLHTDGLSTNTFYYFEPNRPSNGQRSIFRLVPETVADEQLLRSLVGPTPVRISQGWLLDDVLIARNIEVPLQKQHHHHLGGAAQVGISRGLIVFLDTADKPWVGDTPARGDADALSVTDFMWRRSYHQLNITWHVVGVFRSNHTNTEYAADRCGNAYTWGTNEARAVLTGLGYDLSQYRSVVGIVDVSCWFAGMGSVGGGSVMMCGGGVSTTVLAHEFGHNLGWSHGNSWAASPPRPFNLPVTWNAASTEYGDPFEIMGGAYGYAMNSAVSVHQRQIAGWYDALPAHWVVRADPPVSPAVNSSAVFALTDPDAWNTLEVMNAAEGADWHVGVLASPSDDLTLGITFEPAFDNRVFIKARLGTSNSVLLFPTDPALTSDISQTGLHLGQEWCSFNLTRPLCVAAIALATEGSLPVMTVRVRYFDQDYFHPGFDLPVMAVRVRYFDQDYFHPGFDQGPVHDLPSLAVSLTGLAATPSYTLLSGRLESVAATLSNPHNTTNTVYLETRPQAPVQYEVVKSGLAFNWTDIRMLPGVLELSSVNWYSSQRVPLPFPFRFFESTYRSLTVSGNGFLTFDNESTSEYSPRAIPTASHPNALIALRWRYMERNEGSYFAHGTRERFIVQYQNVSGGHVTMQAILYPGGDVTMQYLVMDDTSGTVGLENMAGTAGVSVLGSTLPAGSAVLFRALPAPVFTTDGWLMTMAPFETRSVTLRVNSILLPSGVTSSFTLAAVSTHTLESTLVGPFSVTVTPAPVMTYLTETINFYAPQNHTIPLEISVTNAMFAGANLTITGIRQYIDPDQPVLPFAITASLLNNVTLVPGQTAVLHALLAASATTIPGNFTGMIQLVHNDPDPTSDTVELDWAVAPGLVPNPASVALQTVSAHQSATAVTVQVTNDSPYGTQMTVTVPPVVPRRYSVSRPAMEWVELVGMPTSRVSTAITGATSYEEVALPFTFPFYGSEYTTVSISASGFLTFGTEGRSQYSNAVIPSSAAPNAMIALRWATFKPTSSGTAGRVYTNSTAERFIVQFNVMPDYWATSRLHTMQAILYPNGDIRLQYLQVDMATSVAVGIENEAGTQGIQICRGGTGSTCPDSGSAVLFRATPAPLTLTSPAVVALAAGQSVEVRASLNGLGLAAGNATLQLVLTDALFGKVVVPVAVNATAAAVLAINSTRALGPVPRLQDVLFTIALDNQLGTAALSVTGVLCGTHNVTLVSAVTVAAGATGTAQLRLGPQSILGPQSASVQLIHNDPAPASGSNFTLSWDAVVGLTTAPAALTIPAVAGRPVVQTVTVNVTNASPYPTRVTPAPTLAERVYTVSYPALDWVEMDGTNGTVAYPGANTFNGYQEISLPFTFPFYEGEYTTVSVSGNAFLTFGTAGRGEYNNAAIPSTSAPNALIAVRWQTGGGASSPASKLLVNITAERVIVEYFNLVSYWDHSKGYTMQAILYPSGAIKLQYLSVPAGDATGAVGIENGAGTRGIQICRNTASCPQAGTAVMFTPSAWVERVEPTGPVDLAVGGSTLVNVLVNQAGLTAAGNVSLPLRLTDQLTGVTSAVPVTIMSVVGPTLNLPGPTLALPLVVASSAAAFTLNVSNTAPVTTALARDLVLSNLTITTSSPSVILTLQSGTSAARTLAPGNATSYVFRIDPLAAEGNYWALVTFVHNDPNPQYDRCGKLSGKFVWQVLICIQICVKMCLMICVQMCIKMYFAIQSLPPFPPVPFLHRVNVTWTVASGLQLSALTPAGPYSFVAGRSSSSPKTASLQLTNMNTATSHVQMTLTKPSGATLPSITLSPAGPTFDLASGDAMTMQVTVGVAADVPAGSYPFLLAFAAGGQTVSAAFNVTVRAQPSLVLTTTQVSLQIPVNTTQHLINVTLANAVGASGSLSVTGIEVTPASAPISLVAPLSGLAAGQSANLQLALGTQSVLGSFTATVKLLHNDPEVNATVTLSWTVYRPAPVMVLDSTSVHRVVALGVETLIAVHVQNAATATLPLNITGLVATPASANVTLVAPLVLAVGQSGFLQLRLGPKATEGAGTATIRLLHNDPAFAQNLTLAWNATSTPLVASLGLSATQISAAVLVGRQRDYSVTLTDAASATGCLTVSDLILIPATANVTLVTALPLTLCPGESAQLVVRIGAATEGNGTVVMHLVHNDPAPAADNITLSWAAVAPPTFWVPPSSSATPLSFPAQRNGTLTRSRLSFTNPRAYPTRLAVNLTVTVNSIVPTASLNPCPPYDLPAYGALEAALTIDASGAAPNSQFAYDLAVTDGLTGETYHSVIRVATVAAPMLTVDGPAMIALGLINDTTNLTVSLSNGASASADLILTGLTLAGAGLALAPSQANLSVTLTAGQSATAALQVRPTGVNGTHTATVTFLHNDPAPVNGMESLTIAWSESWSPLPVPTASPSSTPVPPSLAAIIIGAVVGGVCGTLLIVGLVVLIVLVARAQRRRRRASVAPSPGPDRVPLASATTPAPMEMQEMHVTPGPGTVMAYPPPPPPGASPAPAVSLELDSDGSS
ncbi:putative choice-of-anchor D domain [Paratrimastix pyriformis]|uniref:Choice-of-anchor D domain n=1 Tax=Paratrimastix pyriformis TaxID=342808 RepID=A0ABQ8URC5_9EUKA|nr:putative choice-of-anchor D domain [Paratrimastix pyriformis]